MYTSISIRSWFYYAMDPPAGLRTGKMFQRFFHKRGAHLDVNKCPEEIGAGVHLYLRSIRSVIYRNPSDSVAMGILVFTSSAADPI